MCSQAFSEGFVIVDYNFGNQVVGSRLQITEEGLIIVQEKNCCPPAYKETVREQMSPQDLQVLKEAIAQAIDGDIETKQCDLALGSVFGTFLVNSANASAIIRTHVSLTPAACVKAKNMSSAAATIEFLIFLYVKTLPSVF